MDQKTVVLVTGANTGLGYQIIRALCSSDRAYEIVVGGRSLVRAQQAAKDVVAEFPSTQSQAWPLSIDIEDDDSIKGAYHEIETKFGKLDVLVNNAGMHPGEYHEEFRLSLSLSLGAQFDPQFQSGRLTMRQAWNQSWNVNVVGTQIMTTIFVPLLLKSHKPRLVFITSGTSTLAGTENPAAPINKVPPKGWPKQGLTPQQNVPAYRSAKTGMNMMMRYANAISYRKTVREHMLTEPDATGSGTVC